MKPTSSATFFITALFCAAASACPPGSVLQKGNGWEGCVQISGSSNDSPRQKTQWGAIAIDGPNSAFGASSEMDTRKSAEKIALNRCKIDGGKSCKLKLAYYNQCASVISGDTSIFVQSAGTPNEAVSDGISRCENASETGCREHYSGCSLPKRVN